MRRAPSSILPPPATQHLPHPALGSSRMRHTPTRCITSTWTRTSSNRTTSMRGRRRNRRVACAGRALVDSRKVPVAGSRYSSSRYSSNSSSSSSSLVVVVAAGQGKCGSTIHRSTGSRPQAVAVRRRRLSCTRSISTSTSCHRRA